MANINLKGDGDDPRDLPPAIENMFEDELNVRGNQSIGLRSILSDPIQARVLQGVAEAYRSTFMEARNVLRRVSGASEVVLLFDCDVVFDYIRRDDRRHTHIDSFAVEYLCDSAFLNHALPRGAFEELTSRLRTVQGVDFATAQALSTPDLDAMAIRAAISMPRATSDDRHGAFRRTSDPKRLFESMSDELDLQLFELERLRRVFEKKAGGKFIGVASPAAISHIQAWHDIIISQTRRDDKSREVRDIRDAVNLSVVSQSLCSEKRGVEYILVSRTDAVLDAVKAACDDVRLNSIFTGTFGVPPEALRDRGLVVKPRVAMFVDILCGGSELQQGEVRARQYARLFERIAHLIDDDHTRPKGVSREDYEKAFEGFVQSRRDEVIKGVRDAVEAINVTKSEVRRIVRLQSASDARFASHLDVTGRLHQRTNLFQRKCIQFTRLVGDIATIISAIPETRFTSDDISVSGDGSVIGVFGVLNESEPLITIEMCQGLDGSRVARVSWQAVVSSDLFIACAKIVFGMSDKCAVGCSEWLVFVPVLPNEIHRLEHCIWVEYEGREFCSILPRSGEGINWERCNATSISLALRQALLPSSVSGGPIPAVWFPFPRQIEIQSGRTKLGVDFSFHGSKDAHRIVVECDRDASNEIAEMFRLTNLERSFVSEKNLQSTIQTVLATMKLGYEGEWE